MLYALLFGRPPFETADVRETYQKIHEVKYEIPLESEVSEEAVALVRAILVRNPAQRPSLESILEHPFFHARFRIPERLPHSALKEPLSQAFIDRHRQSVNVCKIMHAPSLSKALSKKLIESDDEQPEDGESYGSTGVAEAQVAF